MVIGKKSAEPGIGIEGRLPATDHGYWAGVWSRAHERLGDGGCAPGAGIRGEGGGFRLAVVQGGGGVGGVWEGGGVGSVEKFRNEYPCKYARIVSAANCSVFCRGSANNRFAFQR